MKFLDMFIMGMNNLRRRCVRTALTVMGVVIGACSIIVMLSLGIGLQERNRELIESSGSITTIHVSENMDNGSEKNKKQLTDEAVKELLKLPYVKNAYPVLEMQVTLRQGIYEASYVLLRGVQKQYLEQIPIKNAGMETDGTKELRFIYGDGVVRNFVNRKTGRGFYDTNELPDVDLARKEVFVIFDQAQGDSKKQPPRKYLIKTAGMIDGEDSKGMQHSYAVYTDLDTLKEQLRRIFRKKPVPGQPVTKTGKAYPYLVYNSVEVHVDQIEHVKEVQQAINQTGYRADSNIEWLEQAEEQSKTIQAVLGSIGAVSLFVAAIGIANTMMMSIYERTKEIGVLKVLGGDLGAIRSMFLIESACIGFSGGVLGVALSYGISFGMNHFLKLEQIGVSVGEKVSRIPLWLSASALVFSVIVGMLAGFFPARRAMRLSPLAALRN